MKRLITYLLGVCYDAAKSIVDELETTESSLGLTKIKKVAVTSL